MIEHYIILIDMLNETCVCRLLKAIQVWCLSTYSIEYSDTVVGQLSY